MTEYVKYLDFISDERLYCPQCVMRRTTENNSYDPFCEKAELKTEIQIV